MFGPWGRVARLARLVAPLRRQMAMYGGEATAAAGMTSRHLPRRSRRLGRAWTTPRS